MPPALSCHFSPFSVTDAASRGPRLSRHLSAWQTGPPIHSFRWIAPLCKTRARRATLMARPRFTFIGEVRFALYLSLPPFLSSFSRQNALPPTRGIHPPDLVVRAVDCFVVQGRSLPRCTGKTPTSSPRSPTPFSKMSATRRVEGPLARRLASPADNTHSFADLAAFWCCKSIRWRE